MMAIALGQLIAGAALAVFTLGAGASIGLGLILEGVSDLITAIKDGIFGDGINWAAWAIQKVISLAVSIIFAGLGAIKDIAKTTVNAAKAVGGTLLN